MDMENLKNEINTYETIFISMCNNIDNINNCLKRIDDIVDNHINNNIILDDYTNELIIKDQLKKHFNIETCLNIKKIFYNNIYENNKVIHYHYFKFDNNNNNFVFNFKTYCYFNLEYLKEDIETLNTIIKRINDCIEELS